MAAEQKDFIRLKDEDESFQRRSDFVFADLMRLEPTAEGPEDDRRGRRERRSPRGRRHRRLPAQVPQHVLSPEKWTEYSLEIDGSEGFRGMNEHSKNRHAAHSFLVNLRKRKAEKVEQSPQTSEEPGEVKVSFRKPFVSKESDASQGAGKGAWKDGAFVMPEYMAGVSRRGSQAKRSGVRSPAGSGCAKVSLGHLTESYDDEAMSGETTENAKKGKRRVIKKRKVDEEEEKKMDKEDRKKMDE